MERGPLEDIFALMGHEIRITLGLTTYQMFKRLRSLYKLNAVEKMAVIEGINNPKSLWSIE
jgi:hypothetical protein